MEPIATPFLLLHLLLLLLPLLSSSSSLPPPSPSHISPTTSPSPSSPPTKPSKPSPSSSSSTLDPKQLTALQSLNIPTVKDPCTQPSFHNSTLCDSSKPFRHLISLHLSNCSDDTQISITALKSLYTLQDLQFHNCPISPVRLPSDLIANLHSFTCINSLKKLTGVWLGRLRNVTDLTVADVPINASGPLIILGNLNKLRNQPNFSRSNAKGYSNTETTTQSSSVAPKSYERSPCQICGRMGHLAFDCYNRMDHAYEGCVPTKKLQAMVASSNSAHDNSMWVADSGASAHVTSDLANLSVQNKYHGQDKVVVGNGAGPYFGEDAFLWKE